tara:strand:+ start:673 stop:1374 length:702 start_codon:yes stop_codon:yes gene_type:complete
MTLKLNGSSSGSVSIDAPASTTGGADVALTLPVNDGDANQVLQTNGSGALTWADGNGWVKVFSTSTTVNSDSLDIENTSLFDGTYKKCMIVIYHAALTNDGTELNLRVKLDGSYVTGNGKYAFHSKAIYTSSDSWVTTRNTSENKMTLISGIGNASTEGVEGTITYFDPSSTSHWKRFNWTMTGSDDGGNSRMSIGMGTSNDTEGATAMTGIRLLVNSGNIGAIHYAGYGLKL